MLLYFAIALLGTLLLVVSAVFGEVFDFFDGAGGLDADGHGGTGKVVALGLTTFGSVGMLTSYYELDPVLGAVISGIAALFFGACAWWLIDRLYKGSASTDVSVSSMAGRRAQVTVNIPSGSVGEVLVTGADSTHHMIAQSRDGTSIPAGTAVRIVETLGSMVLVERVDGPAQPAEPSRTA